MKGRRQWGGAGVHHKTHPPPPSHWLKRRLKSDQGRKKKRRGRWRLREYGRCELRAGRWRKRQICKKKRVQRTERHYSVARWSSNIQRFRYRKDFNSQLIYWRLRRKWMTEWIIGLIVLNLSTKRTLKQGVKVELLNSFAAVSNHFISEIRNWIYVWQFLKFLSWKTPVRNTLGPVDSVESSAIPEMPIHLMRLDMNQSRSPEIKYLPEEEENQGFVERLCFCNKALTLQGAQRFILFRFLFKDGVDETHQNLVAEFH